MVVQQKLPERPKLTHLPGTKVYLTGINYDLSSNEHLNELTREGIEKVFFLFPTNQKQLDNGVEFKTAPSEKRNLI